MNTKSDLYQKTVTWSDDDKCFIGTCPGLMRGGIHGDDKEKVYRELCQAVDEVIEIYKQDNIPFPGYP